MIKYIYIGLIVIITIWSIYLYIDKDMDYKNEISRINMMEARDRKRKEMTNHFRLNSTPCTYNNLNNPRDCYIGSNYNCKWSEKADRCNEI